MVNLIAECTQTAPVASSYSRRTLSISTVADNRPISCIEQLQIIHRDFEVPQNHAKLHERRRVALFHEANDVRREPIDSSPSMRRNLQEVQYFGSRLRDRRVIFDGFFGQVSVTIK